MPAWLGLILGPIGWLIKLFVNRKPAAVVEGENLGAAQAQASQEAADVSDISKAVQAANASRLATADPGSLRQPADPDCRDCKA